MLHPSRIGGNLAVLATSTAHLGVSGLYPGSKTLALRLEQGNEGGSGPRLLLH